MSLAKRLLFQTKPIHSYSVYLDIFDMPQLGLWLIYIVLGFSVQAQVLFSHNLTCNSNDFTALKGFMTEFGSDVWISSSTSNCCNWLGITCSPSSSHGLNGALNYSGSGRVVKLELPAKMLTGKLSQSLAGLDQLTTLNLSHNSIQGSLPDLLLLHFPNLRVLDLHNNLLSGYFPPSLNLPSIQIFDVSDNSFVGPTPASICTNSAHIQILNLGSNRFGGSIPPQMVDCTVLQYLNLASNYLSGTMPEILFRLPRLASLSLQDNLFSGQLSNGIGNVSNLVHLDVSSNNLSGNLPDFFHTFPALQYFLAHSNYFTGGIPLSLRSSLTISALSLRNNSLNDLIQFNCSAMSNLASLDLGSNKFHGSIPDNLPACPKLRSINLSRNNISGQIPESFKNFQSLSYISLSNCSLTNLSAALRIFQHCPNLTTLMLTKNFYGEELPSDYNLQFKNLKVLVIANCRLTGIIPHWLNGSTQLQLLDFSWNLLTGHIPTFFGKFRFLFYLDLSKNFLSGEIPKNLTQLSSLISEVSLLEKPSLDFPFFLRRDVSARGLQYNTILSFPPTLDLSNNSLTGPIWPEFGNLKMLHVLVLNFNNLSGSISSTLSGMTSIEILDLSHNNLRGTIPHSLVRLSFLSRFSVAYNHLTGEIPYAGQFPTFQNSSFEGNPGLCGEFVSPCRRTQKFPPESAPKAKKEKYSAVGMPVWVGYVTGFSLSVMFYVLVPAFRDMRWK